jgi:telomerase reverse transcriptase
MLTSQSVDVKEFISARRYETVNLHHILQRFSTSECEWLTPSRQQHRVSVTDALKRRELLEEFLWWFFDGFLTPLLKVGPILLGPKKGYRANW